MVGGVVIIRLTVAAQIVVVAVFDPTNVVWPYDGAGDGGDDDDENRQYQPCAALYGSLSLVIPSLLLLWSSHETRFEQTGHC